MCVLFWLQSAMHVLKLGTNIAALSETGCRLFTDVQNYLWHFTSPETCQGWATHFLQPYNDGDFP